MSSDVTEAGATVSANVATGVDGATSAATFVEDSSTGVHRFTAAVSPTITNGIDYTASIYAKANGRDEVRLTENATTGAYVAFNVSTGSVVNSGLGGSGAVESLRLDVLTFSYRLVVLFLIPVTAHPVFMFTAGN
jgi:hypothetical protein